MNEEVRNQGQSGEAKEIMDLPAMFEMKMRASNG
jgi:hypothetical protein